VPLILGIDPGFSFIGYTIITIEKEPAVVKCGLVRTKRSDKRRGILQSDDNFRRSREIHESLLSVTEEHLSEIKIMASEAMSWPRNASVSAKVGMCWGVMAAIADNFDLAAVSMSPQHLKNHFLGRMSGKKKEIQAAVLERLPEMAELVEGVPNRQQDHIYDAAAVAIMANDISEVARALK
jgi:Holliday junction resolvasome RuvABC endonuclease subunit